MDPPIDRRRFLARGSSLAMAMGGAVLAGTALDGCSAPAPPPPPSTTTTTPPSPADWSALAASLAGRLVLPTTPGYPTAAELYNEKFVDLHPDGIAYCASPDDVARCLSFVAAHGLEVCARSGGHSYGGYSSCSGLVVDVTPMATVSVQANTATIGAGAHLIDVYNGVGGQGRLLPGGSCPTVGIAGLTLGGGQGVFARAYGLTCDHLQRATVVTADATVRVVDAEHHRDLYWALRGGGGGNFAIATDFTFSTLPLPPVTLFTLGWSFDAAADVLSAWSTWIASLDPEIWSNCLLLWNGPAGYECQVSGVSCGAVAQLTAAVDTLRRSVGASPSSSWMGAEPYLHAMAIEAGCATLSVAACHLPSQNPLGQLSRSAFSAKSSYVVGAMAEQQVQACVAAVSDLATSVPSVGGGLAFDGYGGAIADVAADQTAFVHRSARCCIQASYSWNPGASPAVIDAGQAWLGRVQRSAFTASTGAYVNYIDPTLENWAEAYYGANLGRLQQVKARYDPEDRFTFAQAIPARTAQ